MDLSKKVVLITGATSGIGKITAKTLASMGATVVCTTRNIDKGIAVKNEIINETGNKKVQMLECKLESFQSIKVFSQAFKSRYDNLDLLINNAGVWFTKRELSKDGFEMNLAVNYLAPFLLTNLLLDRIKKSAPARIINVSSTAHIMGKINFNDINSEKSFNHFAAYGQTKLAMILFTKRLALNLQNNNITVNCLHPGVVSTNLFDKMNFVSRNLFKLFMITPEKGAETTIYLASSDDVSNVSGKYFVKKKVAKSAKASENMNIADSLWDLSKDYVKDYIII